MTEFGNLGPDRGDGGKYHFAAELRREVPEDGYFVVRSNTGRDEIVVSPDFSAVRLGLSAGAGAVAERNSWVPAPLPHPQPIDEEDIR